MTTPAKRKERTMPVAPPREDGFYDFTAIVSWEKGDDEIARQRLLPLIKKLPAGIEFDTFQGYYLTGERKMIFIGRTRSAGALQELSSLIIYDSPIDARFYHTVEIHKMSQLYEKSPIAKSRKGAGKKKKT
jgi:hypothetical protein